MSRGTIETLLGRLSSLSLFDIQGSTWWYGTPRVLHVCLTPFTRGWFAVSLFHFSLWYLIHFWSSLVWFSMTYSLFLWQIGLIWVQIICCNNKSLTCEFWLLLVHTLRGQYESFIGNADAIFRKQMHFKRIWTSMLIFREDGDHIIWMYIVLVILGNNVY